MRERLEFELRAGSGEPANALGEFENGQLLRIAQIHRIAFVGKRQAIEAIHQIAHVAEAARLRAVAEHRHRLAVQSLIDEGGHHAAVFQLHARAVGIKDARDGGADAVDAVVGHRQSFGVALAFVVAGTHAHRIHVAPIGLHLRMHQRIAIAFRRGGDHEPRLMPPRDLQHVARSRGTDIQRLDGMLEIILGAGERRQVQHAVHRRLPVQRAGKRPIAGTQTPGCLSSAPDCEHRQS